VEAKSLETRFADWTLTVEQMVAGSVAAGLSAGGYRT